MFSTISQYLENDFVQKQVFRVLNYNFQNESKTKDFILTLKSSLLNNNLNEIHNYLLKSNEGYNTEKERVSSKVEEISSLLEKKQYENILDFGCGNGNILTELSNKINFDNLYGIDKINYLSDNNLEFLSFTDKDTIPADNDFFDVSTCLMVLHHTNNPEQYIKEIYRVLKPSGRLIVRETDAYNNELLMFNVVMEFIFYQVLLNLDVNITHNYFNKQKWIKLFEDVGFKITCEISQPLKDNPFTPFYLVLTK